MLRKIRVAIIFAWHVPDARIVARSDFGVANLVCVVADNHERDCCVADNKAMDRQQV